MTLNVKLNKNKNQNKSTSTGNGDIFRQTFNFTAKSKIWRQNGDDNKIYLHRLLQSRRLRPPACGVQDLEPKNGEKLVK